MLHGRRHISGDDASSGIASFHFCVSGFCSCQSGGWIHHAQLRSAVLYGERKILMMMVLCDSILWWKEDNIVERFLVMMIQMIVAMILFCDGKKIWSLASSKNQMLCFPIGFFAIGSLKLLFCPCNQISSFFSIDFCVKIKWFVFSLPLQNKESFYEF